MPPRSADCCCNSLPSCEAANSRTFILPPLFASRISANFLHAEADGVIGVVQVAPPDRPLLNVLRGSADVSATQIAVADSARTKKPIASSLISLSGTTGGLSRLFSIPSGQSKIIHKFPSQMMIYISYDNSYNIR